MRNSNTLALNRLRRRGGGYSLMEIAMVLAIISLLVAGVMLFFSNASTANKTNDSMTEVANVTQVVRSLYAGQSDYSLLTSEVQIAQSGQLPAKWVKGTIAAATGINNPFGGAVNVVSATNNVANDSFTIVDNGIPSQACSKMVTMDLGTSLVSLKTGTGAAVIGRAMSPIEAQAACSGTNNIVTWQLT